MKLLLRITGVLVLSVLIVSVGSSYYQMQREKSALRTELQRRAELVADSLQDRIQRDLAQGSAPALNRSLKRFENKDHLLGMAIFDGGSAPRAITDSLNFTSKPALVSEVLEKSHPQGQFLRLNGTQVYFYSVPLHSDGFDRGALLVVHDASYITAMSWAAWKEMSFRVLIQVLLIALITIVMFQRSVLKPIARTAAWMREARNGHQSENILPDTEMLGPLAREATTMANTLAAARASAQKEAELRISAESSWTAERLAVCLHGKLKGSRLFVVANREPYMHTRKGRSVQTIVPASGLVTALEPVLRACDGTWIAHGSGNADREFVDVHDHVRVPPDDPRYTLRRLWLTEEEEKGYYYGFSNEGLWPLCHIAHTRPIFRSSDWEQYKKVNARFADALVEEMDGTEEPVVIVQDYHFALLPRMIKQRRPDARVGIFWHIPWPNPEAFGICPWESEVLDGLLGADLIGFHVQYHCDNFLETVNRAVESRVEWERFAVNRENHVTLVRPFPISVVFPEAKAEPSPAYHSHQASVLRELGSSALYVGVGVDRVDYTKGILERFQGVERFLEKYPQYRGKYTFIQIGAPSRTNIKRYDDFFHEVETEAARVNRRFETPDWRPIILRNHHHTHAEVDRFYRAADMCLVTSLHDGMNLVAKEFLAARDDEEGVLILSPFTGAARELNDALIVNPYDTDALADAIFQAIEMKPEDRKSRMRRMRELVRQQNVYRWAGCLISELCDVRIDVARKKLASAFAASGTTSEVASQQFLDDFQDSRSVRAAGD